MENQNSVITVFICGLPLDLDTSKISKEEKKKVSDDLLNKGYTILASSLLDTIL